VHLTAYQPVSSSSDDVPEDSVRFPSTARADSFSIKWDSRPALATCDHGSRSSNRRDSPSALLALFPAPASSKPTDRVGLAAERHPSQRRFSGVPHALQAEEMFDGILDRRP
jgi:hypothetical protein